MGWEFSLKVKTWTGFQKFQELGSLLYLESFIWKAMKLPGPGTHFHHNESNLNRYWMLFSPEIEGGLCAMLA